MEAKYKKLADEEIKSVIDRFKQREEETKDIVEEAVEAEIVEDYFGVNCENYFCLWDDPNYCVEEVEVEE